MTTALELEAGAYPVEGFGHYLAEGSVLNYGASAGYGAMRVELMQGMRQSHIIDPAEPVGLLGWWTQVREWFADVTTPNTKVATAEERERLRQMLEEGIDQGGIGIGLPLDYYSEAIDADELLPYMAGSTFIGAAVFGRDWRTIFNIDYSDVEWAATGERFDEATFREYREKYPDGGVIHHYLDEDWNRRAVVEPGLIIVSDLLPMFSEEIKVAPHNGAFSRVLGRYAREESLLSLQTALAKMTLLPARRIEQAAPAFKRKGRLQEGMDADITVFDPLAVEDKATYRDPYQPSAGIRHVIVNGVFVVRDEQFVENTFPGRRIGGNL